MGSEMCIRDSSLAFFFVPNLETTILAVSFWFTEITQSVSGVYVFLCILCLYCLTPIFSGQEDTAFHLGGSV